MLSGDCGRTRANLPEIQVNGRQLCNVIKDAWDAVPDANDPPVLFRRGPGLVRRVETESGVYVLPVRRAALFGLLIRAADWIRVTSEGPVQGRPPPAVVADMLRFPDARLPTADSFDFPSV